MKAINVQKQDFPFTGYYAARILECGHVPGVLSAAELKGSARGRPWYSEQRDKVVDWAHKKYQVDGTALVYLPLHGRRCRVWTAETGELVQFNLI